jgi:prepilin-type N-terminal cleavage/methylation domain-containing protein
MRFEWATSGRYRAREAGFTLIELLVATTMSVVVIGAATSMLITALKAQPNLSKRAENISEARWVLERLTREIRSGVAVDRASASSVSFRTYLRRTSCGGAGTLAEGSPAIVCEVTYTCTTTSCTRIEAAPGVYEGTARPVFGGIDSAEVFCYVPSLGEHPSTCGAPPEKPGEATYVGITLHIPSPKGGNAITVSDGADLRNATLAN